MSTMNRTTAMKVDKFSNEKYDVYADFDDETSSWAVFGGSSGFCYATLSTEDEAEAFAKAFPHAP